MKLKGAGRGRRKMKVVDRERDGRGGGIGGSSGTKEARREGMVRECRTSQWSEG